MKDHSSSVRYWLPQAALPNVGKLPEEPEEFDILLVYYRHQCVLPIGYFGLDRGFSASDRRWLLE